MSLNDEDERAITIATSALLLGCAIELSHDIPSVMRSIAAPRFALSLYKGSFTLYNPDSCFQRLIRSNSMLSFHTKGFFTFAFFLFPPTRSCASTFISRTSSSSEYCERRIFHTTLGVPVWTSSSTSSPSHVPSAIIISIYSMQTKKLATSKNKVFTKLESLF